MNIFYLDEDPTKCAQNHNDKHTVKMIIEYAQLMSTAHRILDGSQYTELQNGRRIKRWKMDSPKFEDTLYKASHINHPSAVWTRNCGENYRWLYCLWVNLCEEYTKRYDKVHLTYTKLEEILWNEPKNIPEGKFYPPPQAMPEHCKLEDTVQAYRNYYIVEKKHFSTWKNNIIPDWFKNAHV